MNTPDLRRCIGFDEQGHYFDCPNIAGTAWTDLWCGTCDERRRNSIGKSMREIAASFKKKATDQHSGGQE